MADLPDDLRIMIPLPSHIRRARGIHSVTRFRRPVPVRTTEYENRMIEEAAAKCGTTMSGFFRWCAVFAAKEILKGDNDDERFSGSESDDGQLELFPGNARQGSDESN